MDDISQKSGWFSRMRARLIAGAAARLVKPFGSSRPYFGRRSGVGVVVWRRARRRRGARQRRHLVGEAAPEDIDLELPQHVPVEAPRRWPRPSLICRNLLEVPLEAISMI